ncbi:MAG TPA: C4-type zinc ribbon domain-containing protein [Planctomycetota bacterium]|nr:C4-type zinc ribbon domain-containing protein [Planctomycetota bacterium]HRR80079.1 C4-type zinc ribbon domain-containing protein [Planctomycetota bacterium]
MPNSPEIDALLSLHSIDSKIDKLTAQKDLLPVALRHIETHLAQQRQALEEKRASVKQLRTQIHAREVDLRAAEQETEKLTTQLNTARTNKEYTAFQHEIAAKKADASRIEDDLLAMMADVEELESDARELERGIAQLERQHAEEAKGVSADVGQLDEQIAELQEARQAAVARVEPALLGEYERIAQKKGSSALAPVVGNSCQGCFMQLPPQLSHTLRAGRKIVKCPSCSRLLYMPSGVV